MARTEATTNVTLRLRKSLVFQLRKRARERDTSLNRIVEEAAERALGTGQEGGFRRIFEAAKAAGARPPAEPFVRFTLDELHEDDD